MPKLKLHLEDLSVESFDTTRPAKAKGTVFGEQCTCYTQCTCPGCPTCANYNTCDATCPNTCDDYSCAGSCGGSCAGGSCGCTEDYTCQGCTMQYDATCFNIGTCDPNARGGCPVTP
ncbi:MAG TPA: hypothetical protein VF006_04185 [Longimicrobium sp.]